MSSSEPYSTKSMLGEVDRANPALANTAVARCCKAWKRAYRASIAENDFEKWASNKAGEAYRAALPPLTTRENCGDFNACVAYGILIGAISEKHSGKLLYAVQMALAIANLTEKSKRPASNALNSSPSGAKRSN